MKKVLKLKDIVKLRSGMVVSKTANNDEKLLTEAFVRMIGTSDFDENDCLIGNIEPNVLYKSAIEKNYLQFGEILFNSKGRRFFAYLFTNEYENIIASASFIVLTLKNNVVVPDFLVWFLNHPETLKFFDSKVSVFVLNSIFAS